MARLSRRPAMLARKRACACARAITTACPNYRSPTFALLPFRPQPLWLTRVLGVAVAVGLADGLALERGHADPVASNVAVAVADRLSIGQLERDGLALRHSERHWLAHLLTVTISQWHTLGEFERNGLALGHSQQHRLACVLSVAIAVGLADGLALDRGHTEPVARNVAVSFTIRLSDGQLE